MRAWMEGQHTRISPELRTMITRYSEESNAQHDDIIHACLALDKETHHQQGSEANNNAEVERLSTAVSAS
jgi:hypothetical protein